MIGIITATRLNVRAKPDLTGRKLGVLAEGTVVNILGQRSGWFEIRFEGNPAFVHGDHVRVEERPPRQTGVTTAHLLNVRDRPSADGSILGTLASGSVVPVLSRTEGWLEIPFQSGTAFVSSTYVELHEQVVRQRGLVTASLLNVRFKPQAGAPVLGQLQKETEVVIEAEAGEWYEIPFNNSKGYVSARYVRKMTDGEAAPPIPIALNEPEAEEEPPLRAVASESAAETASLPPASLLPVIGTQEERSIAETWNQFGGLLQRLSDEKEFDVACAVAVLCVESAGRGFDPNNQDRMIIRFENHKFWRYWGKTDPDLFRRHFTYNTQKVWTGHKWRRTPDDAWQAFHGIQRAEWEVLDFARAMDNDAALTSISMGAPQIMGFHYQAIGYHSVQEMFDAFAGGIEAHIRGLFDFLSQAMVQNLKRRDFEGFAGLYNGSGQKEKYGHWIKRHYEAFKRLA